MKMKPNIKFISTLSIVVLLLAALVFAVPSFAKDTPNPKSNNPNVTYQTIPITMQMEAGVPFEQEWEGEGNLRHSGIGWITPFGRASYVGLTGYPEAANYRPDYMETDSWNEFFGGTGLFCIYSLPDGDIYAWDGVLANIEPLIDDDGKMDYLINVIVGGTGKYKNANGILLGRTPGRGDGGPDTGLPRSLLKLMEGYINIQVKESKYSTALPAIGASMNPQVWPEAWEALEDGALVPMNMDMEAGVGFYEPYGPGFTIHSGIGWLEPFGRAEYVAGVGYPEAEDNRPDFMNETWMETYGTGLFCIYKFNEEDSFYAWDGIVGNIQPVVNDDGKMDYLINLIVGGTGAFEDATGIMLGVTPGRGPNQDTGYGVALPDSILKLMRGYVLIR